MKHPRRKPITPRSKVRAALRQLWLRSRERAATLKRDGYTCVTPGCGAKQSRAKDREVFVQVDHLEPIEWERLIDLVYEMLLNPPQRTLCVACAEKRTAEQVTRAADGRFVVILNRAELC
jgi:acyl-CoA hydrolase